MKQYAMTVIFKDGTVELCKVKDWEIWKDVIPLEGNEIITDDFKIVCDTKEELIDEMRVIFFNADYITIKEWKE